MANSEIHLKYGSYSHASGECQIAISREPIDAGGGRPIGYLERWDAVGVLIGTDQTDLTSKIAALVAAYTHGHDVGLYYENGSGTGHVLLNSSTVDGVKVLKRPSFPEGGHSEYCYFRTYSLAVGGVVSDASYSVLKWQESVQWRGTGGKDWGFVVGQNELQAQTFRQKTPVIITQRGRAVANGSYETPSSPLWSTYEHEPSRGIELSRDDWNNMFVTSWDFVFYAASQLPGRPRTHA